MNAIAKITICAAVALFVTCAGEPMPFESKNERLFPNNDIVCMCFEDNKLVKEYNMAFNVIQESTTRFANHMSDSRFVNNTSDSYFNTMEFKNYYSNVIESILIMNDTLDKLQDDFNELAEDNYDWMIVIAGYVIKREYDTISTHFL